MPSLPPDKLRNLLLIAVGTLVACVGVFYGVVHPLQASAHDLESQAAAADTQIRAAKNAEAMASQFQLDLNASNAKLAAAEQSIAQGDPYRWIINALLDFKRDYKIEFTDFDQPQITDLTLPPPVKYKAASFSVGGLATYHEFGKFLAAFENAYPLIRVEEVQLEPASTLQSNSAAPGKLSFHLQMLALYKPPAVPPSAKPPSPAAP